MTIINLHTSTEEAERTHFQNDNNNDNNHQHRDFKRHRGEGGHQKKCNVDVFLAENAPNKQSREEFLNSP